MNIFLSYSSDRRNIAEQVSLLSPAQGTRCSLTATLFRLAMITTCGYAKASSSDIFVFLISPRAVAPGSYALTELKYARQKWPDPRRKVLPVMIERTEYQQIPN